MDARNLESVFTDDILQSMGDGVLILRADGTVAVANAAARAIMGVEAVDREFTLARVVLDERANDGFLQVLLDSLYEGETIRDREAAFVRPDGVRLSLSVTASHLRDEQGGIKGAFIVLKDATELERLRESEHQLNLELKEALRAADEKVRRLQSALDQGQRFRLWLTAAVILLFVGIGAYHWLAGSGMSAAVTSAGSGGGSATLTVEPRPLTRSISLSGTVAPLEEVVFTAPFQGVVKRKLFHYGDHVERGQVLLELDAAEMETQLRNARAEYIKARKQLMELEDWDKTLDVSRARRDVSQAQSQLATARNKAEADRKLFGEGIIPKSEYDGTVQDLRDKEMQYAASRETLQAVRNKGDDEYLEIGRMELKNAEAKMRAAEDRLAHAEITATVAGIAIRPVSADNEVKQVAVGVVVAEGQPLLSIGSLEGLSIVTQVDELDINSLNKGQPVLVSGDAFPGIRLKGRIAQISSQANDGQVPTFTAAIQLSDLPEQVEDKVRLGMTANMEVETYANPSALLIPLSAVTSVNGKSVVRVVGGGGAVEERSVETGHTSLTEVEILSGLEAGETILAGSPS